MQSKKVRARRKHVFQNYEITNMNHMNGISRKEIMHGKNFLLCDGVSRKVPLPIGIRALMNLLCNPRGPNGPFSKWPIFLLKFSVLSAGVPEWPQMLEASDVQTFGRGSSLSLSLPFCLWPSLPPCMSKCAGPGQNVAGWHLVCLRGHAQACEGRLQDDGQYGRGGGVHAWNGYHLSFWRLFPILQ